MIREALEYIVGLSAPNYKEAGGEMFSDKPMTRLDYDPSPEAVKANTLTSILEYINTDVDGIRSRKLLIHVETPQRVSVMDYLNKNMRRRTYIHAIADIPRIRFGEFVPLEEFKIMLASCFADSDGEHMTDKEELLFFLSNIQSHSVAEYGDDGFSQKAVVSTGLASKEEKRVPNPVGLCPYRSFQEIRQVKSSFVFRLKENDKGICCALFEVHGKTSAGEK